MREQALFTALKEVVTAGLQDREITADVLQGQQPEQTGLPKGPAILMTMISPAPRGWSGQFDKANNNPDLLQGATHTAVQAMTTTVQFNGLAVLNPANLAALTSNDLVQVARQIFNDPRTWQRMKERQIFLFQPPAVRTPYFVDERGRNQASPSFDIVVTHTDTESYAEPAAVQWESDMYRV